MEILRATSAMPFVFATVKLLEFIDEEKLININIICDENHKIKSMEI